MRRHMIRVILLGMMGSLFAGPAMATELVIYGFEGTLEGWEVPDWARTSADYVGGECAVSKANVQEGQYALELQTAFPGTRWSGAYVERMVEVTDWSRFQHVAVDISLPPSAPEGLGGRLILTIGEEWRWTEMNRAIPLQPGAWTTITADLTSRSTDWKFFPDETFRRDVRKFGIRIEANGEPMYHGPIFIDNIRLVE